jgi:hypothetical protein
MATTFKTYANNDITTTRTLLHEAIPITGTIVSGTYGASTIELGSENNIKNYSHGMFQSVYDYPYLSSSANHIFDITCGYHSSSRWHMNRTHDGHPYGDGSANYQNSDKLNLYNQMAQILMGHNTDGTIKKFKIPGGQDILQAYFFSFSRLLVKDEIKKGSFNLYMGTGSVASPGSADGFVWEEITRIHDDQSTGSYYTDSPAGEYGVVSASIIAGVTSPDLRHHTGPGVGGSGVSGLLFYQAGILVLSASDGFLNEITASRADYPAPLPIQKDGADGVARGGIATFGAVLTGSAISASADAFRNRIQSISFNNTTELNSTIYFCRANHNEFNYSANPTYLSASKIQVKNTSLDQPVSYITTVGLYSADNELLAVAKLSEPLKKTPDTELTMRVRLDY